ncbi:MAG: nitrogen fixation protein NifQ, partial [Anaerolineae bacterium]
MSVSALTATRGAPVDTDGFYARLMTHAAGAGNDEAFAAMIATLAAGGGALPAWLGLEPAAFGCLVRHHFPALGSRSLPGGAGGLKQPAGAADPRGEERGDLVQLLLMHKAGDSPSDVWMANVVAAG